MNKELRIVVMKNKIKSIIHDSLFMIHSKGFTLIELLVAISIIGILASFLMVNFIGIRQRSRDGVRKSDLRQIQSALELYRADQGSYPPAMNLYCGCSIISAGSISCESSPPGTIYMRKIPCDPSSSTRYTYSPSGTAYSLVACLENTNDSQKDSVNAAPCDGASNFSYTLTNP